MKINRLDMTAEAETWFEAHVRVRGDTSVGQGKAFSRADYARGERGAPAPKLT